MNDLQILTKAIQRAKMNGYLYNLEYDDENGKHYVKMLDLHKYFAIIFNHNFAKAFFGDRPNELVGSYVSRAKGEIGYEKWVAKGREKDYWSRKNCWAMFGDGFVKHLENANGNSVLHAGDLHEPVYKIKPWQYHLQEMSLCPHPLEYIKYFLGE